MSEYQKQKQVSALLQCVRKVFNTAIWKNPFESEPKSRLAYPPNHEY